MKLTHGNLSLLEFSPIKDPPSRWLLAHCLLINERAIIVVSVNSLKPGAWKLIWAVWKLYINNMHIYIYMRREIGLSITYCGRIQKQIWYILTHWDRDKMADIFQTIFSNEFSWMKMFHLQLNLYWSCLLWVRLTILQHCLDGAKP